MADLACFNIPLGEGEWQYGYTLLQHFYNYSKEVPISPAQLLRFTLLLRKNVVTTLRNFLKHPEKLCSPQWARGMIQTYILGTSNLKPREEWASVRVQSLSSSMKQW